MRMRVRKGRDEEERCGCCRTLSLLIRIHVNRRRGDRGAMGMSLTGGVEELDRWG
jgi:5-carboxymethyl-2-hydroxymuconate isomerase